MAKEENIFKIQHLMQQSNTRIDIYNIQYLIFNISVMKINKITVCSVKGVAGSDRVKAQIITSSAVPSSVRDS